MKYAHDKRGNKLLLLVFVALVIYLSFFRFDVDAAFKFTVGQNEEVWKSLFH